MIVLAVFLILWGLSSLIIGLLRPAAVWNLGKIQGFVKLLGNTGTTVLLALVGAAALAGGIILLFANPG